MVASDGLLRVAYRGFLYCVGPDGDVRWLLQLRDRPRQDPRCHSAPVALAAGVVAVATERGVLLVDGAGVISRRISSEVGLDDSGPSPNVTLQGHLILTAPMGEVFLLRDDVLRSIGNYGYDIVPPALFVDGTLAISGHGDKGFCRIRRDGRKIWGTDVENADLVATVNRRQHSAVASLCDKCSVLYDPAGRELGSYHRPAVFAEAPSGEWIALGKRHIARLTTRGRVRWERRLPGEVGLRWGTMQPIIDGRTRVYLPLPRGLLCLDGAGGEVFRVRLGSQPRVLAMVGPGALALIAEHELVMIE